jgi:soluble lytic murein transglycosylase-like protein
LLTLKHIVVISALALCLAGVVRPAEAQVYSWTDSNGVTILSDHPRAGAVAAGRAVTARVGPASLLMSFASSYEPLIRQHASRQGIRADLVRAVIQVESAFNPRAVSPKGAMGLMQLMPATAARFGVIDPFNPAENIRGGTSYLRLLLDRYNDNEQLALAAYNAGPGAVDKYGSAIPPYRETQDYVRRIATLRGGSRPAPGSRIYKSVEMIDGRPVLRYSNTRPASGEYEDVSGRR